MVPNIRFQSVFKEGEPFSRELGDKGKKPVNTPGSIKEGGGAGGAWESVLSASQRPAPTPAPTPWLTTMYLVHKNTCKQNSQHDIKDLFNKRKEGSHGWRHCNGISQGLGWGLPQKMGSF